MDRKVCDCFEEDIKDSNILIFLSLAEREISKHR